MVTNCWLLILASLVSTVVGCDTQSIVEEKYYDSRFTATKVFEESEDIFGVNYWLTRNRAVGTEAFFVMDIGCIKSLIGLSVRNTHNAHYNDRGMKQFSMFLSDSASGPWDNIMTRMLSDPRNTVPKTINYRVKGRGRFVKVQVDSFYGTGGGLQFFGIITEDCDPQRIVEEKYYDGRFTADKVFEESEDIFGVNYWLTGNRAVGTEAFFVMDIGCIKRLIELSVRNTHNAHYNDRGMKQISVFSSDSASGPWDNIMTKTLSDPRNTDPETIKYRVKGRGRFVKVQVDSFYGTGGGLQFFGIITKDP